MFGSGLSKRPARKPRTACGITRRPATVAMAALVAAIGGLAVPPAASASAVNGATFGGPGTYTSGAGVVYARQGAALSLSVSTNGNTQCVEVIDGANNVVARQGANQQSNSWTFSGGAWLTAGAGNGTVAYTVKAYSGWNSGQQQCTTSKNETFTVLTASYVLDNAAPTATAALSPAPNAAGWNKANVTLTWTGTDAGSGVASVNPATNTVTTEGTSTRTTTVTDNVGNSATSAPATVRIDKTAPGIAGTRVPAPNSAGWNNTDVTVTFTASDATSGVKAATGPTTLTASGANQSVTGTAMDNADNSASATVGGINIDKVAPTLSGTPTASPGASGWYRNDVTIAWTATDALSGATAPADSTITGEGSGLTATASTIDRAGNSSGVVQSAAVRIDRTAPHTVATAPPAWNASDVTVSLVADDALSGVATTRYVLDGGSPATGNSVAVTSEGQHTLEFWSTDAAGNVENHHSVAFGIDKSSPSIGHTQIPAANAEGWNNTDVTVTFQCSDAVSGVASCTGPQDVTDEGRDQVVTGTVRDRAGNTVTDPARVSIDKTAPTVVVDALPAPNKFGWYGVAMTATYTATDALSGVLSQAGAHTFGEGADQTATGTATDAAGNSASATTPRVNVDLTPPTISGRVVGEPGEAGWFSGDVTVHWTCADQLSGIDQCPGDTVVDGEGPDLSATAGTTDRAGHAAYATVDGIRIDRTAPTTAAAGVPTGWVDAPATIDLTASDNLSDVDSTWYAVDGGDPVRGSSVTVGQQGVHSVAYWSVDRAGNREDRQSFTVRLDLTAPEIVADQSPAANAHGWNNTDVSVSFSCLDQTELSGLDACPAPQLVTTEGRGQRVTGTATDHAGNRADATATVNVDKTAPALTGRPDRAPNPAGWYDGDVTVSFEATDGLSGIDTVTGPQHVGEGADQSVAGEAVDNAGNRATATVAGISVDETAPVLSAAPTEAPNEHGWYRGDVTLAWSASDPLSGLAGDAPSDTVLTGEGRGQVATATVRDVAGNRTTATSEPVDIDRTAPHTEASTPEGWTDHGVAVPLTAYDALSGVAATHYSVDGGPRQQGDTVTLDDEGEHTIRFASTDRAGNVEQERTVVVRIDRSAPTITHRLDPVPNRNGWNNDTVTVTFECADQAGLSGIASCTEPHPVADETAGEDVTGTATDNAGNSATDTVTVRLDRTRPEIHGSRFPVANERGWSNTPVTVHFDASDALSGLDAVTPDRVLDEGADQAVEGTATDAAGNAATATVGEVNVDLTAPRLRGTPTEPANAAGWYRGDVTIAWSAEDDLSGVPTAPAPSTVEGEGRGLRATATVTDAAGNSTTTDSVAVDIDRTAPVTGADAPQGWSSSAVAVSLVASDGLSGVATTYWSLDGGDPHEGTSLVVDTEGRHTLRYWSVDRAGNVEDAHTAAVLVDLTRPTIDHTLTPAPNTAGWSNHPVRVSFRCDDALSGVASCSSDVTVETDGRDQVVPGEAVDEAGNVSTDDATVSIDTVDPTITGGPDRPANAHGWYDADVTVAFSCDDALSGVAACSAPVRLEEGRGQEVDGSATDAAGNRRSTTVGPVNVDTTAPALAGSVTSEPNEDGWYRDDVVVRWTATDALSGLDGDGPADSTITSEGRGLTAAASVSDLAGNTTSASSAPVKIDRTPPTTVVSDVGDWNRGSVTVDLTAADNLSGVRSTHYQLDGEPARVGTNVVIDAEGVHRLQVWSVDVAGNVEAQQNLEVKIDRTAPGIDHTQAPEPNARGWSNSDVTVTFTCTDGGSGIAGCTAPVTRGEGAAQRVVGTATDRAGNTATDETTVNVDKTRPTVTGSLSSAPNAHGWFSDDVVATFSCADQDALSGLVSCPEPVTLGEGRGQSAGGTAVDGADNVSEPFRITGIDVDKTRPELAGAVTAQPNEHGWYRDDVVVRWTARDALSGVDRVPDDSRITGEGADLGAAAAVSDLAGNTAVASVGGIRIDRTAPSTRATAPTAWQSSDVTVRLDPSDTLSGVAATHFTVDGGPTRDGTTVTVADEGVHQVSFWSVDRAGNRETPATVTVLVDKTAPSISGRATTSPNAAGWYRTPVTVAFSCGDAGSGIASCQPDTTVAAQGANSVTGTAVDNAGNRASTTVDGIRIDTVSPTVTIGGVTDGATYVVGGVPSATASATDGTSGLAAPATVTTTGGTANGVGTFTATATVTDRAGNTGATSVTYRVVYGYGATLFLQPVNDTAHQTGVSTSVFNAGQSIPMKFQLRNAAGQVIRAGTAPTWLVPVKGSSTAAAVNESAYSATATAGSAYTWDGTQYQYVWKTEKSMAGSYWRVGVALDDGQTYYVNVGLR